MAFSAHLADEDLKETFELPDKIDQKAKKLADLIHKSTHFIVFTGAGVSTAAGIPDFRGPQGKWTLEAQGKRVTTSSECTLQAIPTPTHMALVALQDSGHLKHLVSQNCDGLHRRSGIRSEIISELHGNSNRETCRRCGTAYLRDFRAVASHERTVYNHRTGRKCTLCRGELMDTLVHFGEDLPEGTMGRARAHAERADLCLVLGSSLRVTPANSIPEVVGRRRGGKLVVCNLQMTPLDGLASMRVWTRADELMVRVMGYLAVPIPSFILTRRLELRTVKKPRGFQVSVQGLDVDGTPASFLRSVKVERRVGKAEPYSFEVREKLLPDSGLTLSLSFMGHYNEPDLELRHQYRSGEDERSCYTLQFDPSSGQWTTELEAGQSAAAKGLSNMAI
ncbi:hypothetical protein LTR78_010869 [Recurvomyces mirabilis]|uniref:protein acetyllysine N-acetyltransferase n=1 Tax=Recurvomyces mirabilis TaxID=574656 RepID=A0AAE0WGN6_9PEZI|nr:hypothetical protein LTR78_010869 [Recurvomyces mirabilis]KAK5162363.1 hypothetical protein LTS14_000710 [Recurvomyces mirabilis]